MGPLRDLYRAAVRQTLQQAPTNPLETAFWAGRASALESVETLPEQTANLLIEELKREEESEKKIPESRIDDGF